jgi:hypothetical protein
VQQPAILLAHKLEEKTQQYYRRLSTLRLVSRRGQRIQDAAQQLGTNNRQINNKQKQRGGLGTANR